jgi:hypothetical protein
VESGPVIPGRFLLAPAEAHEKQTAAAAGRRPMVRYPKEIDRYGLLKEV